MQRALKTSLSVKSGAKVVSLEIDEQRIDMGAPELDLVIERLCALRAAMTPAVPANVSRTHQYAIEMDPSWYVEPHPSSDAIVLFLRDSGRGWIGFCVPFADVGDLCDDLESFAYAPTLQMGLAN